MTKKAKPKCGLIMPISGIDGYSSEHWQQVKGILEEALRDDFQEILLVSDANEAGIIQANIIQNIYECDIVVCDVSSKNPNVMFELGMRLAFDKPVVIIKDDATNYIFDTSPIQHINYPKALNYHAIQEFKCELKRKAKATLEASTNNKNGSFLSHFGKYVVANIDEKKIDSSEYIIKTLEEIKTNISQLRASNSYDAGSLFATSPPLDILTNKNDKNWSEDFSEIFDKLSLESDILFIKRFYEEKNIKPLTLADTNSNYYSELIDKFILIRGRQSHSKQKMSRNMAESRVNAAILMS